MDWRLSLRRDVEVAENPLFGGVVGGDLMMSSSIVGPMQMHD